MARGRTPPDRQSFRGCPNVISLCLLMGCKGRFDGACGRLPVSRHIGKTRQIAFVARYAKPVVLRRNQGLAGAAFGAFATFAGFVVLAGFLAAFFSAAFFRAANSSGAFSARRALNFLLPSFIRDLSVAI